MLPKLAAAGWPGPLSVGAPLTMKPTPPVRNTMPRGEFELKKLAGRLLGAAKLAGTPSQLISRRAPVASLKEPLGPGVVPPPNATRYWSMDAWISAGVAPDAE